MPFNERPRIPGRFVVQNGLRLESADLLEPLDRFVAGNMWASATTRRVRSSSPCDDRERFRISRNTAKSQAISIYQASRATLTAH